MLRTVRGRAVFLVSVVSVGCQLVSGVSSYEPGGDGAGGDTSIGGATQGGGGDAGEGGLGGGPPATCTDGFRCIERPPAEWSDPFLIAADPKPEEALEACPADAEPGVVYPPLDAAPPLTCSECDCEPPPAEGPCGPVIVDTHTDLMACNDLPGTEVAAGILCHTTTSTIETAFQWAPKQPSSVFSCVGAGPTTVVDAPVPQYRTCTDVVAGDCAAGVCAREPGIELAPTWCIQREGDHLCPEESVYSMRTRRFLDFKESRGCTDCTCGGFSAAACAGTLRGFTDSTCSGQGISITPNACGMETITPIGGDVIGLLSIPEVVGGVCDYTGGESVGSLTAEDPVTICCTP